MGASSTFLVLYYGDKVQIPLPDTGALIVGVLQQAVQNESLSYRIGNVVRRTLDTKRVFLKAPRMPYAEVERLQMQFSIKSVPLYRKFCLGKFRTLGNKPSMRITQEGVDVGRDCARRAETVGQVDHHLLAVFSYPSGYRGGSVMS